MFSWSRYWTTLLYLQKSLYTFQFQFGHILHSMSRILLAVEFQDRHTIKEFGIFIRETFGDTFLPYKKLKTHKTSFLLYNNFAYNCVELSKFWKTVTSKNFSPKM